MALQCRHCDAVHDKKNKAMQHRQKNVRVLLDTNALLYIERFKIDIFSEIKNMLGKTGFYVTEQVKKELENKMKESRTLEKQGKIAIELMKKNNVKTVKIEAKNADESLETAAKEGFMIVSNDKRLGKKIKENSGMLIYLSKEKMIRLR